MAARRCRVCRAGQSFAYLRRVCDGCFLAWAAEGREARQRAVSVKPWAVEFLRTG